MTQPTAQQQAQLNQEQAFQQQQDRLRDQVFAAIAALWVAVAAAKTFSPSASQAFVAQIVPIVVGGQRTMSALTMAQLNRVVGPTTPIVIPLDQVSGAALRGKDPADYYTRPFSQVLYGLSKGRTIDQALADGLRRADSLAMTDIQLAHTRTAQAFIQAADGRDDTAGTITGYRRVLSDRPNHCALCILASTQRYHKADLMPIHPGCGCTVSPVFDTDYRSDKEVLDPSLAQEIHNVVRRDLGAKYVDAGGRNGTAAYRDIVVVNQNSEIGPVLGVRGQNFEGDPTKPSHIGHVRVNPTPETTTTDVSGVTDLDQL